MHSYRHPHQLTIRNAKSLQHAYQYTQCTISADKQIDYRSDVLLSSAARIARSMSCVASPILNTVIWQTTEICDEHIFKVQKASMYSTAIQQHTPVAVTCWRASSYQSTCFQYRHYLKWSLLLTVATELSRGSFIRMDTPSQINFAHCSILLSNDKWIHSWRELLQHILHHESSHAPVGTNKQHVSWYMICQEMWISLKHVKPTHKMWISHKHVKETHEMWINHSRDVNQS